MPGETLQTDSKAAGGGVGGVSSAVPLRILNKGPEYFRRANDANPKRLSAVERLEADKAKYVKSQEVINARQEPAKAPAASPDHAPEPASGPALSPSRPPPARGPALKASNNNDNAGCRPGNLNLELLKNLLNGGEGLPRAAGRKRSSRSWAPQRSEPSELLHRRSFAESLRVFPSHGHAPNLNLDPPPPAGHARSRQPWLHVSHSSSDIRRICRRATPPPAAPSPPPEPHAPPAPAQQGHAPEGGACASGGGAKRPSLRRSKSDLSERHARAEADLERFFNQCGLEPDELELLGLQGMLGRPGSSDMVSLNLHSASAAGSEPGGRGSRRSDQEEEDDEEEEEDLMDDEDEEDRVPYGISAVERNARVIKWLYSIRQNRESQRVSHV